MSLTTQGLPITTAAGPAVPEQLPKMFQALIASSGLATLQAHAKAFNANNLFKKRLLTVRENRQPKLCGRMAHMTPAERAAERAAMAERERVEQLEREGPEAGVIRRMDAGYMPSREEVDVLRKATQAPIVAKRKTMGFTGKHRCA